MKKRILSILLAVIMVFSVMPTNVMASDFGNLEFSVTKDDHIGDDGKSIKYENGYTLSVSYDGIGDNQISNTDEHTELRNIPNGTTVTFTLTIPDGQNNVPTLLLSGARETFIENVVERSLDFSAQNVIPVSLDFGGNPGPGPAPETENGDVLFHINNGQSGIVEYSSNNTDWTSVTDNSVLKANDLSGVTTIYIKVTPNEGQKLDDYIDNGMSVNRVTIDGTASALDFTDNVASFAYNSSVITEVTVRFMDGGQGNPGPGPDMNDGDIRFEIQKSETDISQYSLDGTNWISVENNAVVKAEDLSGAGTIYVKAVPSEGRQLDDYVDNDGISANKVCVGDNTSSLVFDASGVASFAYNNSAKTVVTVRFMDAGPGGPDPGQDEGHIVKIQINNNDGANGTVLCKFNTEQNFNSYTVADKDGSGNIKVSIPEGAETITFKAEPGEGYAVQDCTIMHDDKDIDETKAYRSGVEGDGYAYTIPDDDKTIVFKADFGNELISWHSVSWGGGNVHIENGRVEAYAVQVGENTYDESVETADETNKRYPLSYITGIDIQTNPVAFGNTDMFIADTNTEDVSIDFRFIPDYGYQVTDVIATEGSVLDQFNPGEEISTFHFVYIPKTNVHFIVEFTSAADIINTEGSIVSSATIGDGANAISSGNLKMDIGDVDSARVSEGLKDKVGENDAQYLDMTLSQVVSKTGTNGNWESQLSELDGAIDVSLTVSDLDPDGEYYIIREHTNGGSTSYDEIPVTYNPATNTITFESDKFSTYALVKKSDSDAHTHGTGDGAITFEAWDGGTGHDSMPTSAGNFYLTQDITLTSTWNVPDGITYLCLNGHVINANGGSFSVITIGDCATLELYDCGTTEHKGYTDADGLWYIGEKASLSEGEIARSIYGGIITGGRGNTVQTDKYNGGGVLVEGTFNMYGGTIAGNKVNNYGGGVKADKNALFTIHENAHISGNVAQTGGGVHFTGTTFTMDGGSIDNNIAAGNGGGVCFSGSMFNMSGGSIDHNKGNNCGGVQITNGTFGMIGGSISYNTASSYAGLLVNKSVTLGGTATITGNVVGGTITGGTLSGGTANNVYVASTQLSIGDGNNGAPAPSTGFKVGVTTHTAPTDSSTVPFTSNGASTDTGYFVADNTNYVVKFDTNHLVLAVAPPHTHHLVKVDGQAATKTASGWNDYYECMNSDDACHKYFEEENGTTLIENLETWKAEGGRGYIAPLPYTIGDLIATVENFPTTAENGWVNENNLKMYFADEKLNINGLWTMYENLSSAVEPSGSNFVFSNSSTNFTYTFVMENNVLTKVTVAYTSSIDFCGTYVSPVPENYTVTFDMKGHGNQIASQTVAKDSTASQPVNPSASGWTFGGWYSDAGLTVAYNFSTPITTNTTIYAKWTQNTPSPDPYYPPYNPDPTPEPTPEVTPAVTPEPVEEYIVPVESDKESVQINAKIEDGIAAIDEITEDTLEGIIDKKPSGEETGTTDEVTDSITIDLSEAKQDVTGAELTKKSVENLADVVNDKNNNFDSVIIEMKEASVELDAKTLETLHDTMAGDSLKLVIDKTEEKKLNTNQKSALSNYNVAKTFEAFFESNGEKIHDFNGGTVKVSVKFTPGKGKKAENYKVYYIDENGKMQKFATKYENGLITFVTGHFSDYAVIYDNVKDVLLAEAATTKKGYIKLSWNKIEGAERYVVYGAKCGKSYKELTETEGNSVTIKKISGAKPVSGKTYKLYVAAYDALGNKIKSKSIHYMVGDTSTKYANVKAITALQKTLELTVGEKVTVDAEYAMYEDKKHTPEKHGKALRFTSDCPDVAKVAKDGTVTAKSEGKAVIYIQDISGKWCQVEVTVKEK